LLDRLASEHSPALIRGDANFGNEPVMREAEQRGQPYLFKLRLTKGVKRAIERAMGEQDWQDAGAGWYGRDGALRLLGWSRQRRVVMLRRRVARSLAITEHAACGQLRLGFAEINDGREVWEYAVLVTSLTAEILTIGQLYRDRADCENGFDELKNHWGWGGFTTHDLKRCRLMARCVALVFNWWNLFVRLADPDHHREAVTSRPLLLQAIGRQTKHAGRTTVTITSTHGEPSARTPGAYAYRCVLHRLAKNCGAVDRRRALVPNPQPRPRQVFARATTRAAKTPPGGGRHRGALFAASVTRRGIVNPLGHPCGRRMFIIRNVESIDKDVLPHVCD
jgi:hypothetical protein